MTRYNLKCKGMLLPFVEVDINLKFVGVYVKIDVSVNSAFSEFFGLYNHLSFLLGFAKWGGSYGPMVYKIQMRSLF